MTLTANPTVRQATTEGICAQSDDNISRQVAGNLSLEAHDFSYSSAGVTTSIFWLAQGEQNNVDMWLEQASVRYKSQCVNLCAATLPNNQCADVVNREVAGLIDTTTEGQGNLPGHPTSCGTANAANTITEQIR